MSHHHHAAAVLLGSLSGSQLQAAEREFLRTEVPAGITLFARNLNPHDQSSLLTLLDEIQSLRPKNLPPFLIAIDQEGGRVARLRAPFPNLGAALKLEEGRGDEEALSAIQEYGRNVGQNLKRLGVNVNFAPVVDVLTEPSNHAIGDRTFGTEPTAVVLRAGAFLRGLQQSGMLACLKHFPGQGAAKVDTHLGAAVIDRSLNELTAVDLQPFYALHEQAAMIMTSHCIYPCLDQQEASLSSLVIENLLRQQIGFSGVVVSDDMTMGAITTKSQTVWLDHIIAAIAAGNDLVLICEGLEAWQLAVAHVNREAERSPIFRQRLIVAANRVTQLRARLY